MEFRLPKRFDESVFNFLPQLQELGEIPDLILDFRLVEYVFPFPTLTMAIALRELIERRSAKGLKTSISGTEVGHDAISYLKYFGFFRGLGFPIGNYPNQSPGGMRYLPITIITQQELENASNGGAFQIGIDRHSDRLAQVIFPGPENAGPAMMLSYCFREIIRNSFEHAGVSKCYVMAQRWVNGNAEITIADRGIGIYSSLMQKHAVSSPEDAIGLALLPGITSGADRATGSEWDNSGFGLYVISELGRRFGDFEVLSSNTLLTNVNPPTFINGIPVRGTIVKLKVNTRDSDYFPNILAQIVKEGEAIAGSIAGAVKTASKMSKTTDSLT